MKISHFIYKTGMKIWNFLPFKRQIASFIKHSNFPVEKLYRDLWFEGPFYVEHSGKRFQLVSSRDDKGTLEIFWKGLDKSWDAYSINIWGKMAEDAKVVFDIGANMGLYSIVAETVNPKCQVYAFEPSRRVLKKLKQNLAVNNHKTTVVPVALSNLKGELEFYDSDSFTAVASLKPNENIINSDVLVKYKVPVMTLKEFVEQNRITRIDLISIDVEMNEPEVLQGMEDIIEKFKPDFIIEVLNNEIGKKIESYLQNMNYLFFEIDEESGLSKTENLRRSSSKAESSKSFNFLVCQPKTAKKLELDTTYNKMQKVKNANFA